MFIDSKGESFGTNLNLGFAFWLHIPGGACSLNLNLKVVLWLYISGGALCLHFDRACVLVFESCLVTSDSLDSSLLLCHSFV